VLVVRHTEHFRIESPTIVTIGTFDGVHLGHQKILQRLLELKTETGLKTVVLTFDPHPRKVLFPEQTDLKLLSSVDEKLQLLEKYDVDVTVVYPFTSRFSELEAENYVSDILVKQMKVRYLVIGYDHKFGRKRTGDIHLLRSFAEKYQFEVEEISAKDIDQIAVSSSKIRKALEEGDVELAAQYLGHPFVISGKVVEGKQLGRTLGFPTANIAGPEVEKIVPKTGVYFVGVEVEGRAFYGMLSLGYNPTTDHDEKIKTEVYIFDFNRDIYFQEISVSFIKRLRDEKKFKDLEALKNELKNDQQRCLELISEIEV